jgi:hypothetical protein
MAIDPISGQSATSSTTGVGGGSWLTDLSGTFGNLSSGMGFAAGVQAGGVRGDIQAAQSAAKLVGSISGPGSTFSSTGNVGGALADITNLSNIITGLQQGGVSGYGGATINTAALAARTGGQLASAGAFGSASGEVGSVAGEVGQVVAPLASALSIYNFAKGWQSGATGADALRGMQTGATIGTEIMPGIGTAIGALGGAAVGAVSSLFGPGRMDPENVSWDQYAAAYSQQGAGGVAGATPSQNFQMLAGIFDARGSSIPFYNQFGRMGENQFMSAMTGKINQALASGQISGSSTPDQIYSSVVQPWINQMAPGGWQASYTAKGAPEQQAIGNLLTNLIGQWQSGQITGSTPLGISGQTISGLESFGAQGTNPQAAQQTQAYQQQGAQQVTTALQSSLAIFRQARIQ